MVKYLSFCNSCFALRYFFNVNGQATSVMHPLLNDVKAKYFASGFGISVKLVICVFFFFFLELIG